MINWATGSSVYQFILDKKVEYISNELLTTNKSLLDIAIEVGFNDVRNAYRIFKNKTGYTPMQFREKFTQKIDNEKWVFNLALHIVYHYVFR